jgi:hypothetical protein
LREVRRAWDYQIQKSDGSVQIYEGHPCFCMKHEEHKAHMFRYEYRLRDGSIARGSYACDGLAQPDYPRRYVDMPMPDKENRL